MDALAMTGVTVDRRYPDAGSRLWRGMRKAQLRSLVEAARVGDVGAWQPLVDEFLPTVLAAAYGLCRDRELAHDIAQESLAIAIEKIHGLRDAAAFPGWLVAIVRSVARRARPAAMDRSSDARDLAEATTPEQLVGQAREGHQLRAAIERLPATERLPIVLHYFARLSLSEIAIFCRLPLPTVKKRMRSARARLEKGGLAMTTSAVRQGIAELAGAPAGETIRFFCAIRAGDRARVAELLERNPSLANANERFTTQERYAHRLALNDGGTPLLRAIERGDDAMVALLLERGADPRRACTCSGAETPLWTAVVHRRPTQAALLLGRGADPNATAFAGTSALQVARMRGYSELVELLSAFGAKEGASLHRFASHDDAIEQRLDEVWWTGIRAVDLWCPLPVRGVVRCTAAPGSGCLVLLGELAWRAAREGRAVVWAGVPPPPLDRGDYVHGLAELGVSDCVQLRIAPHDAPKTEQLAALDSALSEADAVGAMLVMFEASGSVAEIEARLPELARRAAPTVIVAPFGEQPPAPTGSPYLASLAFDRARAERQQWPAISAEGTWSRVMPRSTADLAASARGVLSRGGAPAEAIHRWLSQPFFSTEPFSGIAGESTSPLALQRELEGILQRASA
jgi:RNA polymerase sigma-70 factor (ECF subfamily)